jgi:hypothetical protein
MSTEPEREATEGEKHRWSECVEVQKTCRECRSIFHGQYWKSVLLELAEDAVIWGLCPKCQEKDDAAIKAFSKTFNGSKKAKSEAPDLEMPDISPELAAQQGLDFEAPKDDGEYGFNGDPTGENPQ